MLLSFSFLRRRVYPHMDEDIHLPAADHAFFAGLVGGQRKMMEAWHALAQGVARFRPDFGFDAAAADSARALSIFKEQHFGSAPLRRRPARVRHRSHDYAFAASIRVVNQTIEIVLSYCTHRSVSRRH